MKTIFAILLASAALVTAEPPQKDSVSKYSQLWTRSLITVPPPPELREAEEETTPLDDYVLGGYTKLKTGYFVSLINTKDRTDRLTISSNSPGSGKYSVLKVETNPENFSEVKVLVRVGDQERWIGYDEKFLNLSRPAAPSASAPPSPEASNNRGKNNQPQTRRPRVRRVPVPPTN